MSTARCLGDRDDRRGLGGSYHGSRVEADPPTSCRASFDRSLPGAGLDDLGGDATHSSLGGRSDGGSYRGWRRAVFRRGRFSRLESAALPEGYLARLRAGRGQLPLRGYFAWRGVGPIVTAIATISRCGAVHRDDLDSGALRSPGRPPSGWQAPPIPSPGSPG